MRFQENVLEISKTYQTRNQLNLNCYLKSRNHQS